MLYNYKDIADYYLKVYNIQKTMDYFQCDRGTVKRALNEYNIKPLSDGESSKKVNSIKIARYDLNTNEILQIYNSQIDAAKDMYYKGYAKIDINNRQSLTGTSNRLGQVARGMRKSAYGFG